MPGDDSGDARVAVPVPHSGGRLPRSARRAQLLGAAQRVFVAAGYHQAAMDDIADAAGVSKPVLYQHFPSKLDLYLALLDTHVADLIARIENAMSITTNNKQRVYAAVSSYFDFVGSEGAAYRLVFESDLRNDPQVSARVERAQTGCIEAIAQAVASDTHLDSTRSHFLSVALTGASEASARRWLNGAESLSREDAIELVSALLWRGISAFPK